MMVLASSLLADLALDEKIKAKIGRLFGNTWQQSKNYFQDKSVWSEICDPIMVLGEYYQYEDFLPSFITRMNV